MGEEDYGTFLEEASKHFAEDRKRLTRIVVIQGVVLTLFLVLFAIIGSYQLNSLKHRVIELSGRPTSTQKVVETVTSQQPLQVIGSQGSQGVQGVTGADGSQGVQGVSGVQGNPGVAGVKGDKGDKGDSGTVPNLVVDNLCRLLVSYPGDTDPTILAQLICEPQL